ncbi:hypothetical protein [Tenacibaculum soleae]|uniref:Uncharacterized protein n=1 Tax=Tenacibaculum soleae TaxID=447689 RepID=A0A1B9XYF1_9FLAO|nr:hypothetical protein [Tenacibaculum soleae]MDO6813269.1 hypothetical protein [Tenacibaculum soleae]OCK42574.1 hypothetical protein BA195_10385 [Tenacibaculum soleae]
MCYINSTASIITLNWTNVHVTEISRTDGSSAHFYVDDIVFTPPPCIVTIPDVNFKSYLVNNTAK